jgi:hypothetical protein
MWCNIEENDQTWNEVMEIFIDHYRGRMRRRKARFIIHNAKIISDDDDLGGDVRQISHKFYGNEINMLRYLRNDLMGIKIKAFWLLREMRMNGVWDIHGQYCCVPDKQVGRSLERWNYINGFNSNFNTHLRCSQIIWNHFGEMYDFPILHYSRVHRCNSRRRRCTECEILDCRDRDG